MVRAYTKSILLIEPSSYQKDSELAHFCTTTPLLPAGCSMLPTSLYLSQEIAIPDVTDQNGAVYSIWQKKIIFFFFLLSLYLVPAPSFLSFHRLGYFCRGVMQLSAAVLWELLHTGVMRDSLRASFMPPLTLKPIPAALGSNEPPVCQQ